MRKQSLRRQGGLQVRRVAARLGRLIGRIWTMRPAPAPRLLVDRQCVVRPAQGVALNQDSPAHIDGRAHGRSLILPPGGC